MEETGAKKTIGIGNDGASTIDTEKTEVETKIDTADKPDVGGSSEKSEKDTNENAMSVDNEDDTSSTSSENDKKKDKKEQDPTVLIMKAVSYKEEGNGAFKKGDYSSASRSYRRGTNLLKGLNEGNTGDEQVKALLVNLQTNLSMTCMKQNKAKMSRDVASKALAIQDNHVKALFRRATAHRALGDLDSSKQDLKRALKEDPNNKDCKRALISVQKEIEKAHEKQKAALSRAFSSKKGKNSASFLYNDKEEEEIRKQKQKEEEKKQKELEKQKHKQQWEEECISMMADNPDIKPPSFEEWDKERQKKQDEEEKKRKKEKEEERKRRQQQKLASKKKKAQGSDDDDDDDDDILTEKELQMMRGYKKTSDGRTTSYFTREQTEEEKKLLGSIAPQRLETPQRLDSNNTNASIATTTSSISTSYHTNPSSSVSASAWNQAGTWEERDTTDWCKETLKSKLKEATAMYGNGMMAIVSEVKDLSGDASVAVTRGKKTYVFDFHCKLKYKIHMATNDVDIDDTDEVIASGTLSLPDISSASMSDKSGKDLDVEMIGWKKVPKSHTIESALKCREQLADSVRSCVATFVDLFNSQY